MWRNTYKDYPIDVPFIKEQVEPSKGIVGCEMHDLYGWGHTYDLVPKKKKKNLFKTWFNKLS